MVFETVSHICDAAMPPGALVRSTGAPKTETVLTHSGKVLDSAFGIGNCCPTISCEFVEVDGGTRSAKVRLRGCKRQFVNSSK